MSFFATDPGRPHKDGGGLPGGTPRPRLQKMKKSLPGPRLTRRFGGPSAAAFGGRGGFRLPGSNVRTVAKIDFFSAHTSHAQLQRGLRAQWAHGLHVWHAHLPLSSGSLQCSSCLRASTTLLPRTNCARCPPNDR